VGVRKDVSTLIVIEKIYTLLLRFGHGNLTKLRFAGISRIKQA